MEHTLLEEILQDSWNITFANPSERTYELCELAVLLAPQKLSDTESILHYVPPSFRTLELCELAIERDGCSIRDVPAEILNYDLCLKAVKKKGSELYSIPKKYRRMELIRAAIEENGIALSAVARTQITEELCWLAMKTAPYLFCYLPKAYQTRELLIYAQRRYPVRLPNVSNDFLDCCE